MNYELIDNKLVTWGEKAIYTSKEEAEKALLRHKRRYNKHIDDKEVSLFYRLTRISPRVMRACPQMWPVFERKKVMVSGPLMEKEAC